MYCQKCGAPLQNGAKFCGRCGTEVTVLNEEKKKISYSAAPAANPLGKTKQKRFHIIVTAVIGLTIAIALGLGVVWVRGWYEQSKETLSMKPNALFEQGHLLVSKNDGYTYVNENGDFSFLDTNGSGEPKIFDGAQPFGANGKAIVWEEDGNCYVMDAEGKQVASIDLAPWYNEENMSSDPIFFPFDQDGFSLFGVSKFGSGSAFNWGFVNDEGEIVAEPDYLVLTKFNSNGKALAVKGSSMDDLQLYLLDQNGNETPVETQAFPLGNPYSFVGSMENEALLAAIDLSVLNTEDQNSVRMGFLTPEGEWAIDPAYHDCGNFSQGRAWVSDEDDVYFIDAQGNRISDFYDGCGNFTEDGLALVMKEDEWGDKKYGYIDLEGNEVIPLQYSHAKPFANGRALVKREVLGASCYIGTDGTPVTLEQYGFSSGMFSESGLAPVVFDEDVDEYLNPQWSYIDLDGNIVLSKRVYAEPIDNIVPGEFDAELGIVPAITEEYGLYHFIDLEGNSVGTADFDGYYTTRIFFKALYGYDPWYVQSMY